VTRETMTGDILAGDIVIHSLQRVSRETITIDND